MALESILKVVFTHCLLRWVVPYYLKIEIVIPLGIVILLVAAPIWRIVSVMECTALLIKYSIASGIGSINMDTVDHLSYSHVIPHSIPLYQLSGIINQQFIYVSSPL